MTGEQKHSPQSIEDLARAVLTQVDFADHSDEEGARNALREIGRLCREALQGSTEPGASSAAG